jgi:hypothetical protein
LLWGGISDIFFSNKVDRPFGISQNVRSPLTPQLNRGAIALFVGNVFALKGDRLSQRRDLALFEMERAIAFSVFLFLKSGLSVLGIGRSDHPFGLERASAQNNLVKQHFKQRERLKIDNYC